MSSNIARLWLPAGLAIVLAGVIAWGQDRQTTGQAGRDSTDVFNVIEGRTVVITSVPEGSRVKKGDIVCELDSSELRDRLSMQEIVVRAAEFDWRGATLAREAAGMKIVEYVEGNFKNNLATTSGEIKSAEARLSMAEDQLDWSRRMFEKGYISNAEKVKDELLLKEARLGIEATQYRRKVLLDYTKNRALTELKSEADRAMSLELAKEAGLLRERSVQKRLKDQIDRCKVTASSTGRITFAAPIGPGAVVHDGQLFGRIVATDAANTETK
jgi:HlyD family secretion protein